MRQRQRDPAQLRQKQSLQLRRRRRTITTHHPREDPAIEKRALTHVRDTLVNFITSRNILIKPLLRLERLKRHLLNRISRVRSLIFTTKLSEHIRPRPPGRPRRRVLVENRFRRN